MCWFVHTYWFVHVSNHVFPPGHHRPNIWKTQPLDLDQGLSVLTRFFEGPTLGNFCLKISPLSRNSAVSERYRPGREGLYENA